MSQSPARCPPQVSQPSSPIGSPSVLERSLRINKNRHRIKESFIWCSVNVCLLAILIYDLSQTCPLYLNYYHYIEYSLIIIFSINVLYYFGRIVKIYVVSSSEQIQITNEQKKLLGVKDTDPNYKIVTPSQSPPTKQSASLLNTSGTPLNMSAVSWRSNVSSGESMNYSVASPNWSFHKGSPTVKFTSTTPTRISPASFSKQSTPMMSSFHNSSIVEEIEDEDSLHQYLKDHEEAEKVTKLANKSNQSLNLLSSFWTHPVSKTAKDMSSFLKKCQYQLSTQSPTKITSGSSPTAKQDDKMSTSITSSNVTTMEAWTRINVDAVALTQWNENLRRWISQTILERLTNEFDIINDSLTKHGMTDIRIGSVGLDRLRKTAQMVQITQFIPSLAAIIPFLEVHANQEYLEKRIRELARGGCMSDFKWNGGGHYHGKDWDDSLPTDCAIIMHLLASYLDTQLMPSPNMPDTKSFSGHYYIKSTDKMPNLTANSLFIQEVVEKPPHYRVVVGERMFEMVKGYNNLFHSILFFLYHVNKVEGGMLGRVNLGRAGVNMLWIIGIDE